MNTLTRRHFIRSTSVGAGVLLVGFQLPALGDSPKSLERLEGAAKPLMTDAFIRINPDNTTSPDESRRVRQRRLYEPRHDDRGRIATGLGHHPH